MDDEPDENRSTIDSLTTVASGGMLVSGSKVISLVVGFLAQIAMARLLTESGYGQVVLTLAVTNFAALVATLGLGEGLMREFPHHEDEPAKASGVIRAGILIGIVSGGAIGVAIFLLAPILATVAFDDPSLVPLLRIGAIGVPCLVFINVAVALAQGGRDARVHAYVNQLSQPTFRMVFITILLLAGIGAIGAVAGAVTAFIISAIFAVYLAYRSLPSYNVEPAPMYREVLLFSIPLLAANGMGFVNSQIDIFMIGYFLESSALGIYNISLQLSNVTTAMFGTLGFLLPPMLTRLYDQDQKREMRRLFQLMAKWTVILSLPAFIVLIFATEPAISLLFGRDYSSGATALRLLLVGKLYMICTGLYKQSLVALGHNRVASLLIFIETLINVVLNLLLVPIYGFEGAALAMSLSTLVGNSLGIWLLYRWYGIQPQTRALLKLEVALGGLAAISYLVVVTLNFPLAFVAVVLGIAYLPIVLTVGLEPEDEMLFSRFENHVGYDLTPIRQVVRRFTIQRR